MRLRTVMIGLVSSLALLARPHAARGELLLYEPFDYGGSDAALGDVSGSALGLDDTAYTTGGTVGYVAAGLSFGDLAVRGGTARLSYDSSQLRTATRGLDLSVTSGTLYGSYLYRNHGSAVNGVSDVLFTGSSSAGDTAAKLNIAANEYDGSSGTARGWAGIRTGSHSEKLDGAEMDQDGTEVYMVLFQVTNVGAAEGTQSISAWVLNDAQFAHFKPGGLSAEELDAAAADKGTGEAADQVLQLDSLAYSGPNYISLLDSDFMRLYSYRGNGAFDEIRLATSMDDATPVPEPAGAATLLIAAALATRRRHRHTIVSADGAGAK